MAKVNNKMNCKEKFSSINKNFIQEFNLKNNRLTTMKLHAIIANFVA